jgi:hypothetical protein
MSSSDHHTDNGSVRVVLASRQNAGIQATLLWSKDTNAIAVLVCDDGADDQFELSVEPDVSAIDTYEHPYACAVWRGVDYRLADLREAACLRRSVAHA